ncbi:acyltransferase family protein [Microbacter sp. GSS18]|nr:acyltransferase family protein [Microbacter sp. GSS18]
MSSPSAARYAGLDGLRAIAVALVLVYHLFPPGILPGGFIGVDVFFVISGFLITSLLLREHVQRRASITAFWRRRARRLLPALGVMIAVCASLGLVVGGDVLYRVGAQVAGAATFTYNWWTIAADSGYFAASSPEIFRNVWSLAVEEQFYLLLPLVLPLFFLLKRTWMLVAAALVLAAASASQMGLLLAGGADPARVYYGTDTHAFGLLLGVATAFALAPVLSRGAAPAVSGGTRTQQARVAAGARGTTPQRARVFAGARGTTPQQTKVTAGARGTTPQQTKVTADARGTTPQQTRVAAGARGTIAPGEGLRFVDVPPKPPEPGDPLDAAYAVLPAGWTIVLPPSARPAAPEAPRASTLTRVWTILVGAAALAGLVWVAVAPAGTAETAYAPSLLAASALATAVVVAAVWPGSPIGRALDAAPLRWVGQRSYGLYLWHWPLLVLAVFAATGAGPETGVPAWIGAGVLVATVAVAWASYRFVEEPVRRHGFRGAARRFGASLRAGGARRLRPAVIALATVVVIAGTTGAIAAAPEQTSAQAAVAAGEAALAEEARQAALEALAEADAAAESGGTAEAARSGSEAGTASAGAVDTTRGIAGTAVDAIGDSVMLAASPALLEALPGIRIDAEVSRSMWAAPRLVSALTDAGSLRDVLVIALGTNGPIDPSTLDTVADVAGPRRTIVLVNASAPRSWIPGVNETLRAFADAHDNVIVADWASAIGPHAGELASDRIHPGAAAGRRYAAAVLDAVERGEQRRLDLGRERLAERRDAAREDGLPVPQ